MVLFACAATTEITVVSKETMRVAEQLQGQVGMIIEEARVVVMRKSYCRGIMVSEK